MVRTLARSLVTVFCVITAFSCATPPKTVSFDSLRYGISGLDALAADGPVLYALSSVDHVKLVAFPRSSVEAPVAEKAPVLGMLEFKDGKGRRIAAAGGRVFVAAENKGVLVVDARDPARMVLAGTLDSGGSPARSVLVSGGLLFAGFDNVISVYDLASRPVPAYKSSVSFQGIPYDLASDGSRLFAALGRRGAAAFSVREGGVLRPAEKITVRGAPTCVAVRGAFLYLTDDFCGLQVVELSGAGLLRSSAAFETNNLAGALAAGKDFLVAGSLSGKGAAVFSLADPGRPVPSGVFRAETRCEIRDLLFEGNAAVAVWQQPRLLVFDPAKAGGTPAGYRNFDFYGKAGPEKRAAVYLHSGHGLDDIDGKEVSVKISSELAEGEYYRVRFASGKHRLGVTFLDGSGETTRRTDIDVYFEEGKEYALVFDGRSIRSVQLAE